MEFIQSTIYELYHMVKENEKIENSNVELSGWIRTNRCSGAIGFIEFNDGSNFRSVQIVYDNNIPSFDVVSKLRTGCSIVVKGEVVLTPENKQPFEVKASEVVLVGDSEEDYPLQKKRHSFEFMREISHLRPKANTFNAVNHVRNVLSMAIHEYLQTNGFMWVHTPIITSNDAEGAGSTFRVITNDKNVDDHFFGEKTSLSVSGQLHVEAFAVAFRDVYTFGPTFRAENSHTTTHAAEFWMIEPEMAFADLEDDMYVIEEMLKHCVNSVLTHCKDELEFFNSMIDKTLLERLNEVVSSEFKKMSYTAAIDILKDAVNEGKKFENNKIEWGMDLQTEHERYLTDVVVKGPVFLFDYPKDIKAFYMKRNKDGKTVAACDLLVPSVGELVGGSQREDDYEKLKEVMIQHNNLEGLEWYLDLRKYGSCPHAGFGLGFDRLLMYVTGMSNIRDVQPFPRAAGSIKF